MWPSDPVSCRTMPRRTPKRRRARRTSGSSNNAKLRLRETKVGTSVSPTTSASRSTPARISGVHGRRVLGDVGPGHGHAGVLQALGLVAGAQRGHQLVDVPLDDAIELVEREPDAVVGDPVLREVVGAD